MEQIHQYTQRRMGQNWPWHSMGQVQGWSNQGIAFFFAEPAGDLAGNENIRADGGVGTVLLGRADRHVESVMSPEKFLDLKVRVLV